MGLVDRVDQRAAGSRKAFAGTGTREDLARTLEAAFSWGSGSYSGEYERIENDFRSYVAGAYKGDGIVFSAIDRRQQVFSQARFMWPRMRNGRPADLFTSADLRLLEQPWPNGTTGALLAQLGALSALGHPVLVGASRKRFLGELLNARPPKERDDAGAALTALLARQRVWAVRTHTVRQHRDAIAVVERLRRESRRGVE